MDGEGRRGSGVVWCWNVELKGVVHGECSISCCILS